MTARFLPSLPRGAAGRLLLALASVAALGASGAGLLPRLIVEEDASAPTRPAGAADPALFEFSQMRQSEDRHPAREEAAPAPTAMQSVPVPVVPPARAQRPNTASSAPLPTGVTRFEACLPNCDSRDPARAQAAVPLQISPAAAGANAVLRPPAPMAPPESAPTPGPLIGFLDRTLSATGAAIGDMTDKVKNVLTPGP